MIEQLQRLMNEFDSDVKIDILDHDTNYNILIYAYYKKTTFSISFSRNIIQDMKSFGFSDDMFLKNIAYQLIDTIKKSKIYIRNQKLKKINQYKKLQDYMDELNPKFRCYYNNEDLKSYIYCKYKNIETKIQISGMDASYINYIGNDYHKNEIISYYIKELYNKMITNKQYIRLLKFEKLI